MVEETIYLTRTRDEMLNIRAKADTRDQAGSLYRGQRIVGYREWRIGSVYTPGFWRAVVVLADGMRVEIDEAEQ
jgi:hypothetical protein